ncbi:MAG TPA: class I SAM-dependent methyltransferase [Thermoleophilia bacterium]|nr:class I SAM-dependent methyltransferase [Thermoleophilia bacterium]
MDRTAWDERYRQTDWVWSTTPNQFVAQVLADMPPGRALDLACGEGRNALWLAEKGWRATAVDFSSVAVAKGRAAAESRGLDVTWIAADLLDYEPERGAYDAVLIAYLHLPPDDMHRVLGKARDALADGGTLLVVGHDVTNLTEGTGGPQDPAILYTPDVIVEAVTPLSIERAERVLRHVDGADRPAIDTLVVAVRRG